MSQAIATSQASMTAKASCQLGALSLGAAILAIPVFGYMLAYYRPVWDAVPLLPTFQPILWTIVALSTVATTLGLIARNRIRKGAGQSCGRGLATSGIITGGLAMCLGLFDLPLFCSMEDSKMRLVSLTKLKAIGMAVRSYHRDNQQFPPSAIRDKQGRPLLSWRVLILPHLDQEALFSEFRLDEPWDSQHNLKLLSRMPKVYAPVGDVSCEPHMTFYQVFVGNNTAFERDGLKREDMADGINDTIAVIEAGEPVPWTKPQDLLYDSAKPLPPLGGVFKGKSCFHVLEKSAGACAVLVDGSVHFLPASLDETILRALITRNGGEKIDWEKIMD